jgi:O-antigen ligase
MVVVLLVQTKHRSLIPEVAGLGLAAAIVGLAILRDSLLALGIVALVSMLLLFLAVCPLAIPVAFMTIIPLEPLGFTKFSGLPMRAAGLCLAGLALCRIASRRVRFVFNVTDVVVLLLLGWYITCWFVGEFADAGRQTLQSWCLMFITARLVCTSLASMEDFRRTIRLLGLVYGLFGVVALVKVSQLVLAFGVSLEYARLLAFYDANYLSLALVVGFVASMWALNSMHQGRLMRSVLIGSAICCALGALATLSRTGIGLLLLGVICGLWNSRKRIRISRQVLIALLGLALFVSLVNLFPGLWNALSIRLSNVGNDVSTTSRFWAVRAGLAMWASSPFVGVGLGKFPDAFSDFRPPEASVVRMVAHNSYVELLAETGVVGMAVFTGLLVYVLFLCIKRHLRVIEHIGSSYSEDAWGFFGTCALIFLVASLSLNMHFNKLLWAVLCLQTQYAILSQPRRVDLWQKAQVYYGR